MVQLNWPNIQRHRSLNILDHAASLEADFENLDACVELSLSKTHRLPSSLLQGIVKGILKAFSDSSYPQDISEADSDVIGALLIKHITAEAAERARDRIPLRQYHDLRKSVKGFVAKFNGNGSRQFSAAIARRNKSRGKDFSEPSPELETLREVRDSISRNSEDVRRVIMSNGCSTRHRAVQVDSVSGHGQDATEAAGEVVRPRKDNGTNEKREMIKRAEGGEKSKKSDKSKLADRGDKEKKGDGKEQAERGRRRRGVIGLSKQMEGRRLASRRFMMAPRRSRVISTESKSSKSSMASGALYTARLRRKIRTVMRL